MYVLGVCFQVTDTYSKVVLMNEWLASIFLPSMHGYTFFLTEPGFVFTDNGCDKCMDMLFLSTPQSAFTQPEKTSSISFTHPTA